MVAGILIIAVFGIGVWNRRAPANSIDEEAIKNIEARLLEDRFVQTNVTFMHSEAVAWGIPISKIFGTAKDSANLPFIRDGANLAISYGFRREHAFDISISADPALAARANQIAAELTKMNPAVAVMVWTNDLAGGASK
jgi:hypothetical protein